MSFEALKSEIDALSAEERIKIWAYLDKKRPKLTDEERREFDRMIDDDNPNNWVSLRKLDEALEARRNG